MRKVSTSATPAARKISEALAWTILIAILSIVALSPKATAAEFGSSLYPKGFRDVYSGVTPSVPGLYVVEDVYHYAGKADALLFNGSVQLDVDVDNTADIFVFNYVTKTKILGGTYSFGISPSIVGADVDVGLTIDLPGPPTVTEHGGNQLNMGDTIISPINLGWQAGNWYATTGMLVVIPTGKYDVDQLANTTLYRWGVIPTLGITYLDQKSQWQLSSEFAYVVSFENPITKYESGDFLHIDSSITKSFGPLGIGAVAYAMMQTTGDNGPGAKFGSNKAQVYGVGPIVMLTLGNDPDTALSFVAKWYHEFGAEHTLEGDTIVGSANFKF